MSEGPGRNPRHEHIGAMPRSSFVAPPHIKDFFYRYSGMARSLSVGVSAGLYRYLQMSPQARALMAEIAAAAETPVPVEVEALVAGQGGVYDALLQLEERGDGEKPPTGRRGRAPLYKVKMEPGDLIATPGEMEFLRRLGGSGKGALSRGVRLLFQELTDQDAEAARLLKQKNGHVPRFAGKVVAAAQR